MAAVRSKCYFFTEKKPTVQMMPPSPLAQVMIMWSFKTQAKKVF